MACPQNLVRWPCAYLSRKSSGKTLRQIDYTCLACAIIGNAAPDTSKSSVPWPIISETIHLRGSIRLWFLRGRFTSNDLVDFSRTECPGALPCSSVYHGILSQRVHRAGAFSS